MGFFAMLTYFCVKYSNIKTFKIERDQPKH